MPIGCGRTDLRVRVLLLVYSWLIAPCNPSTRSHPRQQKGNAWCYIYPTKWSDPRLWAKFYHTKARSYFCTARLGLCKPAQEKGRRSGLPGTRELGLWEFCHLGCEACEKARRVCSAISAGSRVLGCFRTACNSISWLSRCWTLLGLACWGCKCTLPRQESWLPFWTPGKLQNPRTALLGTGPA